MSKKILFNKEAKVALLKGVNVVADAVGSTLGAAGKTVIISRHYTLDPIVSKDGVTVSKAITLDNEIENAGARMIREVATRTVDNCGDGTTTSTVLAQSIINEGVSKVLAGANQAQVKRGIELAVNKVTETLKVMAVQIGDDNDKIRSVATISANNDSVIGGLIADAYAKIGNDGLLLIENSGTIETKIDVIEGVEIPRGFMSPHFANNKDKMQFAHEQVMFLIADYDITSMMDLAPILNKLGEANLLGHALVIIAQDYQGEAYSSMIVNNNKGITKVCLVKAPQLYRNESMDDIAIITGATVIRDQLGLKMENVEIAHLGKSDKVVISEFSTTIIGGKGEKLEVDKHKHEIKIQLNAMKDEALKVVWEKRLAQISGSIAVIKVGGSTDVEIKEKLDRWDDAIRAVKSAIEEGIVVGGGIALIRCMDSLDEIDYEGDESVGIQIIRNACMAPLKRMLLNASLDKKILNKVAGLQTPFQRLIGVVPEISNPNYGYNIKTEEYCDLFLDGVIDPAKVVRCAMQNAASVGIAIVGSDCLMVEMK